jgi:hypothetical protein
MNHRGLSAGLRRDEGSLVAFTSIAFVALILLAGVVLDLGAALDAKVRALHVASEAARMGAQQLDLPALHRDHARVLNTGSAQTAALKFLAASGATGTAAATTTAVTVHTTVRQHAWILSMVGITSIAMTADATSSPKTTAP